MDETRVSPPPAPEGVPGTARPVFLDTTGRRRKWLGRAGRGVAAVALVYLFVVAAVLRGPPTLARVPVPASAWAPAPSLPAPFGGNSGVTEARLVLDYLPPAAAHRP